MRDKQWFNGAYLLVVGLCACGPTKWSGQSGDDMEHVDATISYVDDEVADAGVLSRTTMTRYDASVGAGNVEQSTKYENPPSDSRASDGDVILVDGAAESGLAMECNDDAGVENDAYVCGVENDAEVPVLVSNAVMPTEHGALVITEIMKDPEAWADKTGEWFELFNPSAVNAYNLAGCVISDNGRDRHVIQHDLTIGPESYIALASGNKDGAAGFLPHYVYAAFALSNDEDEVILTCDGIVIDAVAYDATLGRPGASIALNPCQTGAVQNDAAAAWCIPAHIYGVDPDDASNGDRGTPGQANAPCSR